MDTKEQNQAIQTLASVAADDYGDLNYQLLPAFEALTGRHAVDFPRFDDDIESLVRETATLARLESGSILPFDLDERLGNNDADYLTALEQQQRTVDDCRYMAIHGDRFACADCRRTTINYHPAVDDLYCAEHAQFRAERNMIPARLVAVQ